jgi:hypothetical protein
MPDAVFPTRDINSLTRDIIPLTRDIIFPTIEMQLSAIRTLVVITDVNTSAIDITLIYRGRFLLRNMPVCSLWMKNFRCSSSGLIALGMVEVKKAICFVSKVLIDNF